MTIKEVHWESTNRCNLRCKHCLPESGLPRRNELTTQEAFAAIDWFQNAGVTRIAFTGGEPFARPDLLPLMERASGLGLDLSVITNGTLLGKLELSSLRNCGASVAVSVDGASSNTNDAIRGKGTFRRAVEAVSRCREQGLDVDIFVTINQQNFSELEEIARLALDNDCRTVHYNEISLYGRARLFESVLGLSSRDASGVRGRITDIARSVFQEEIAFDDEVCWADGTTLYMTAEGDLYSCSEVFQRRPDLTIGNIRTAPVLRRPAPVGSDAEDQLMCCYGIAASERVVLVYNTHRACAIARPIPA